MQAPTFPKNIHIYKGEEICGQWSQLSVFPKHLRASGNAILWKKISVQDIRMICKWGFCLKRQRETRTISSLEESCRFVPWGSLWEYRYNSTAHNAQCLQEFPAISFYRGPDRTALCWMGWPLTRKCGPR